MIDLERQQRFQQLHREHLERFGRKTQFRLIGICPKCDSKLLPVLMFTKDFREVCSKIGCDFSHSYANTD